MREISWKHVTIVVTFFGAVVVLAATGNDIGAFVAVGMGVFAALGLIVAQQATTQEKTSAVQQQTNGNYSRALDIIERQGALLAQMQPPPAELLAVPAEVVDEQPEQPAAPPG